MATAAESTSSTDDPQSITASTSSVDGRGRAVFASSSGGRRVGSSLMRRSSFLSGEVSALPEIGERTIYVTDDGLIDTGEPDQLSDEFQHRLDLLQDEQQELSEIFKVRIGLATKDREQVDRLANEIDAAMSDDCQRRDDMIQRNRIDDFAARNFQRDSPPVQFTSDRLRRPLLAKNSATERRASLAIWIAILRFIDGVSARKSSGSSKMLEVPIISQVWDLLETCEETTVDGVSRTTAGRRPSLKSFIKLKDRLSRRSSRPPEPRSSSISEEQDNDDASLLTNKVISGIPSTDIDLANYVVAHGILNKQLRDEIFCQLCCVVTNNPSVDSRHRAWMLHFLCAACFLPSVELMSYYYVFLYEVSADDRPFANFTRRMLRRTNSNGMRFHPPNFLELSAAKTMLPIQLEVWMPNGRSITVSVDSASTSSEMCEMISANLNLKDSFGFSLHMIMEQKVSSLGSGLDHVMDAISECEQMVRSQGRLESSAPWQLYYRKELFTPWYNPNLDQVATDLIYRQIVDHVRNDDYRLHRDDIVTYVARCIYIDYGRNVQLDLAKSKMNDYFPRSYAVNYGNSSKGREALGRAVMTSFEQQGFSAYAVPAKFIRHELVASASTVWPTNFSAMFEAYCVEGPVLPSSDVIVAINNCGVFLLDMRYEVIVGFHFYDIVDLSADNSWDEIRNASMNLLAVDGAEFKLLCPNSETVARIVTAFLEGLRRRSRWAIALDQAVVPVQDVDLVSSMSSRLDMKAGDLVELIQSDVTPRPSTSRDTESRDITLLYGRNEATGRRGSFTASCVYILPTVDKPTSDFVSLMKSMIRDAADTFPRPRRQPVGSVVRSTHDESAV